MDVSHLTCLSAKFLTQEPSDSALLPRGGTCGSCGTYVLWGDVIRGSYRRYQGGAAIDEDEEEERSENTASPEPARKPKGLKKARNPYPVKPPVFSTADSSEGEVFDLDGIDSDSPDVAPQPQSVKMTGLSRSISHISVSSPASTPRRNTDVIEISD